MPVLEFHFLSQQKELCEGSWPGWNKSMKASGTKSCLLSLWHSNDELEKVMIYEEMKQPQVADWEPSFEHRKKGTKKG